MSDVDVSGDNYGMNFDQCDDVRFMGCYLSQRVTSVSQTAPMIRITKADFVRFEGNVVTATVSTVASTDSTPALAIALMDAEAETRIEDNFITGIVSIYGLPAAATLTQQQLTTVANALRSGALRFSGSLANFYLRNNTMYRLNVSQATIDKLRQPAGSQQPLTGFYRRCFVTNNALSGGDNLLVMEHLALSSDTFDKEKTLDAGAVVAAAAIYVGNFAPAETRLFNATAASDKVGNLGINIVNV
jgi:hypothetical protein